MIIEENINLSALTTFKVGGAARYFARIHNEKDLAEAVVFAKKNRLGLSVLGGGSNVLINDAGLSGLTLHVEIKGVELMEEKNSVVFVAGAGENWDSFVKETVERGYSGLENLSGIPGTVGGAPVQNIGAYGSEVKDSIVWVQVFNLKTGKIKKLKNRDCKFSYRDSFFKTNTGKDFAILRVAFRLPKSRRVDISYKDLKNYFGNSKPSVREVREAVLEIRKAKFSTALQNGTAGSFFKNPVVSKIKFNSLKKRFPNLPGFPEGDKVKISLGWIIENVCGLKGYREGQVGISPEQAIVVVNYGGATSSEIKKFSEKVIKKIQDQTGIKVEPEVRYLG